mmetsp:Transcript_11311/g.14891  ORF Transcript_11311/g.14891 Transcript_11311/m.14891 type:complete len:247 (+) Transcript_11311:25-765(+)
MLILSAKVASSAIAAVLTFCSVRNIVQTSLIVSDGQIESSVVLGMEVQDRLADVVNLDTSSETPKHLLQELSGLSRKESVCLFASCSSAKVEDVEGEWNIMLLENNGVVMTNVASFMTEKLFSKGRLFLGKSFSTQSRKGINLFQNSGEEMQYHEFDFNLEESRLLPKDVPPSAFTGSSCIALDYTAHQPILSLWKSMRDEVRPVPLPDSAGYQLMVGIGCMAWSGGLRNGTPFCLWRCTKGSAKE